MNFVILNEKFSTERIETLERSLSKHWFGEIGQENKNCKVHVHNTIKDFIQTLSKSTPRGLTCVSLYDTLIPLYNAGGTIRAFNAFKKKILIPSIQYSKDKSNQAGKLFIAENEFLLGLLSKLQDKNVEEIYLAIY